MGCHLRASGDLLPFARMEARAKSLVELLKEGGTICLPQKQVNKSFVSRVVQSENYAFIQRTRA